MREETGKDKRCKVSRVNDRVMVEVRYEGEKDKRRWKKRSEKKRKEKKTREEKRREREKMKGNERMKLKITCLFISFLFVSYVRIILVFPFSFFLILISIFYTL